MIKNDKWILQQAEQGMITPFEPNSVKQINDDLDSVIPVLSFGLSSYGYDVRLSPEEFLIFRHIPGTIVNPKKFKKENLESINLHSDKDGKYFIIPANSYGLGVSLETLKIPDNVIAICLGKSTYARVGLIANITPLEASWQGNITLEFSNSSNTDCRIYANEGVVQLLFFEGEPCQKTYEQKGGRYQKQGKQVTFPKV